VDRCCKQHNLQSKLCRWDTFHLMCVVVWIDKSLSTGPRFGIIVLAAQSWLSSNILTHLQTKILVRPQTMKLRTQKDGCVQTTRSNNNTTLVALLLLDSTLRLFPANGRPIILTQWITAMTTNKPTRQRLEFCYDFTIAECIFKNLPQLWTTVMTTSQQQQ
jgi:hypothetical protein